MKSLIYNAFIITQNEKREIIERGFIVVQNNKILQIGNKDFIGGMDGFDYVLDMEGKVIAPGLINAHVHLGETAYKDFLPEKFSLEEYLARTNSLVVKFPFIEKYRKTVADYTILQLIKSGTSTIAGGRVDSVSNDWDVRNISGYMVMNNEKLKRYYEDIRNSSTFEIKNELSGHLSNLGIFIHSLNYVDERALLSVKNILKKMPNFSIMIHVAETKKQEDEVLKRYGKTSVEVLEEYGLLSKHTLLVHANWCTKKDFDLIKKHEASIVHCLSSNLKVADKVMDINEAVKNGINVCIATDGFCTSETFNVLAEAQNVLSYNKNNIDHRITPQKVWDMVTIDAAKALGVSSEVGSIEVGKHADLIFIDTSRDELMSPADVVSFIVGQGAVTGLMIDGSVIMWDKRVSTKDEKHIVEKYRSLIRKIREGINENYSSEPTFRHL